MGPGPLWDSRAPLTPGRSARIVNECMDWYWRLDAGEDIFWALVGVFGWCLSGFTWLPGCCLDAKAAKRYLAACTDGY